MLTVVCFSTITDAMGIEQSELAATTATIQAFVERFAAGQTHMENLFKDNFALTNVLIKKEAADIQVNVNQLATDSSAAHEGMRTQLETTGKHLTSDTASLQVAVSHLVVDSVQTKENLEKSKILALEEANHHRLLKSLKYGFINDRRNGISCPHERTFVWIFGESDISEDGVSDDNEDEESDEDDGNSDLYPHSFRQALKASDARARKASTRFITWLRSPEETAFWISGKAASGKSTLMKMLAGSERVREHLGPSVTQLDVLSHFIWSSGPQPIQRTVKGILCSLLYHLLVDDQALRLEIYRKYCDNVIRKDEYSDWSETELVQVLLFALKERRRLTCMFIDGVDEILGSDGQMHALDVIEQIRRIPLSKVCVSSRPEGTLPAYLGHLPMFSIQNLTGRDILNLTSARLRTQFQAQLSQASALQVNKFLAKFCDMADGVFLWAVLALNSLRTGLELREALSDLHYRLLILPGDLKKLYKAMWARLSDDAGIYQRDAAVYFGLVLESQFVSDSARDSMEGGSFETLHLLLGSDRPLREEILSTMSESQSRGIPDNLNGRCGLFATRLEARCSGMLVVQRSSDWPANGWRVDFIHRTAKEYLTTDGEGRELLLHDEFTTENFCESLITATLAATWLGVHSDRLRKFQWPVLTSPRQAVSFIYRLYSEGRISKAIVVKLMFLAEPVFESLVGHGGRVFHDGYWATRNYVDFLGAAAFETSNPKSSAARDFVADAVQRLERQGQPHRAPSATYLSYLPELSTGCCH